MSIKHPGSASSLESDYHRLIPISAAIGLRVERYDDDQLVLSAPLSNNVNHQQSAFGGSLFSLAALAGWGILQVQLNARAIDANIVIGEGNVRYLRPVFADFQCVCDLPASSESFFNELTNQGRASITLLPRIESDGRTAMELSGNYVVSLA